MEGMPTAYSSFSPATETAARRTRDVTWGRILFQPPALLNPRLVFDPLPFRTQRLQRSPRSRSPFGR
jgi:hypothetical protein